MYFTAEATVRRSPFQIKGEIMITTSDISHLFEAGADGTTLMQLEFLPEIFSHFSLNATVDSNGSALLWTNQIE